MALTIQEERYSDELAKELEVIFLEHWEEISAYKDIPLSVDWETYKIMDEAGKLLTLTARNNGELIGYAVYILSLHPHYNKTLYASQDILFVRRGERRSFLGAGLKLLKTSEEYLKDRGVDVIQHHVKCKHDFSPLLERIGYEFVEKIYQKRLN